MKSEGKFKKTPSIHATRIWRGWAGKSAKKWEENVRERRVDDILDSM